MGGNLQDQERSKQDAFECIEMFYNPKRKHANTGMLSPFTFEQQQKTEPTGCLEKARANLPEIERHRQKHDVKMNVR